MNVFTNDGTRSFCSSKRIKQSDFLCFGGMDPPISVAEAGWYGGMPLLDSFMMDGMGWNAVACMYAD
jgi:hypothetical protein